MKYLFLITFITSITSCSSSKIRKEVIVREINNSTASKYKFANCIDLNHQRILEISTGAILI